VNARVDLWSSAFSSLYCEVLFNILINNLGEIIILG